MVRWGCGVCLILAGVTPPAAQAWPVVYHITQIGGSGVTAYAINNAGQVTGSIATATGAHAFLFDAGVLTDLGSIAGYDAAGGAINDAGQIVGDLTPQQGQGSLGFLYSHGTMTVLPTLDAGTAHCCYGTASAINNSAQVAGTSSTADGSSIVAVIYTMGVPQVLPFSHPSSDVNSPSTIVNSLNDYGQATGYDPATQTPYVYSAGLVTHPFQLANTKCGFGDAINNAGQVAGYCVPDLPGGEGIAAIYSQGVSQPLPRPSGNDHDIRATSMNNAGQITLRGLTGAMCCSAWLYSDSQSIGLFGLIDPTDPLYLSVNYFDRVVDTIALNDAGWIVVSIHYPTRTSYLLTPETPYPSTVKLTAFPSSVAVGAPFKLAWTDQNVETCSASGGSNGDGWGGSVPTHGGQQQLTETSAGNHQFTITCAGASGPVTSTAAVTVNGVPPPVSPMPSGGGGSEDPWLLWGLLNVLLIRWGRSSLAARKTGAVRA
jgi:probable HAF family extracellular repeat protein